MSEVFSPSGALRVQPAANPRMRPWITDEDKAAVMAVLDRGDLMSGREVQAFEEELAAYFGKRHAVCVSSGTAALECAFRATDEGTKLHPDGYVALLSAALAAGKTPECSAGFGVRTALMGIAGDGYKCRVLDAAHAFGTKNLPGDVHCYSFNANKFIACVGGVVTTNDSVVAAHCRQYRNHGRDGGPECFGTGRNHRMGEVNAALGRSQLKRIDDILGKRKQVADWYAELTVKAEPRASWFMYPVPLGFEPKGFRTMEDFRLFGTGQYHDKCTALLPVWPLMTREDVQAIVKELDASR